MMKNLVRMAAVTLLTATAVGVCALSVGNGWDSAVVAAQAEEPTPEERAVISNDSTTRNLIGKTFFQTGSSYTKLAVADSVPDDIEERTSITIGSNVCIYGDAASGTAYIAPTVDGMTVYAPEDASKLFSQLSSMKECDISGIDWSGTISMQDLFSDCSSLETVNLSGIDTSNVTTMEQMFYYCSNLVSVDFGDKEKGTFIDTSGVLTMKGMFYNCLKLKDFYLPEFDLSSCTNIASMFYFCTSISDIDLTGLSFPKVETMESTFSHCNAVTEISLKNVRMPELQRAVAAFGCCANLEKVDLSGMKAEKLKDVSYLFEYDPKLLTVDFSNVVFPSITNMTSMFEGCSKIQTIDMSSIDCDCVEKMSYLFFQCSKLTTVDMSNISFESVTSINKMFSYCQSLETVDFSKKNFALLGDCTELFAYCSSLQSVDFTDAKMPNVKSFNSMFYQCKKLNSVSFSGVDTSNVQDFSLMFYQCEGLDNNAFANLGFDTSSATDMTAMFSGCIGLTSFDASDFDMADVQHIGSMFYNCSNLTEVNWQGADLSSVSEIGSLFYNCKLLKLADFSGCGLKNVTYCSAAFHGCEALKEVKFDEKMEQLTYMDNMFAGCSSLKELDLSGMKLDNVMSFKYVFSGASGLEKLNIWNMDFSKVKNDQLSGAFRSCKSLNEICVGRDQFDTLTKLGSFSDAEGEVSLHKDQNGDNFCDYCPCYLGHQEYLAGTSLMLGSKIGVNFYFGLGDEASNNPNAYVKFSLPDKTEQIVYVKDAVLDEQTVPGQKYYVFPCYIIPFYYQDNVTARLYFSDGKMGEKAYSFNLKQYGEVITSDTTGTYSEECKNLVTAMLNYCKCDYQFFSNSTCAISGINTTAQSEALSALNKNYVYSAEDPDFVGASLITESQMILRLYFKNDFEGSCGKKGDYYYVQYAVSPAQFAVKDPIAGYCVNNYLCACMNSRSASDKNLWVFATVLYRYGLAAEAYQTSISQ